MADWPAIEARIDGAIVAGPLAEPAIYTSFGGTPREIRGVFSPTSVEVDPETSALVRTNQIVLEVRISDLEAPPNDGDEPDEVNVRGVDYVVVDHEAVGHDWSTLHLHIKV